jgi:hypothetical protein
MLAAIAGIGLAGCETGNNLLGSGGSPAPQAAISDTQQPAAASAQTARIEIAPVIGAPEAVAHDLQIQLTSAMERSRITVARPPSGKGEFVLRGYVVAAREKAGSKISYIWDVTDQTGKRANRITGEEFAAGVPGKDPWSSVTPQIIQSIADKTASQIATWLPGSAGTPVASNTAAPAAAAASSPTAEPIKTAQAATAATQTAAAATTQTAATATQAVASAARPVATPAALTTDPRTAAAGSAQQGAAAAATTGSIDNGGTFSTVIPAVTGAPGDGSTSLTGAIQRELTKRGVNLSAAPNPQAYKVEGKVAVGQGKDGKQPIQIDWHVIDPKGKKLGTVSQKNEVPQGSLDAAWGKTADVAAEAAAQGILKLLPQKSASN